VTTPPLPPAGWYPDPAGTGGRAYWNGREWAEAPKTKSHKLRNGLLIALGVFLALVVIGNLLPKKDNEPSASQPSATTPATTTTSTATPQPMSPPAPSAAATTSTTDPPGGRMPAIFCSFTGASGEYYFQFFNARGYDAVKRSDKCDGANRTFTQEEFQAIPGLKRQCVFDRDEDITMNDGFVSIYSDETQGSIESAQLICANSGY
jgi:hypothetical protein